MLDKLNSWFTRLGDKMAKQQFSAKKRIRFYNNLMMLLENRVMLIKGLHEMYLIASDDGKKARNADAIILKSCYDAMNEGKGFSEGLAKWVEQNEIAIITSGEKTGNVQAAFEDAIGMIEAKNKIRSALMGAMIYPVVLLIMLVTLLHIIASSLVPKLSVISNPQNWEGTAYVLYLISEYVNNYGRISLICLLAIVIFIVFSFPFLTGRVRSFLDRYPPWALYRAIHGSIFMINVSSLLRSKVMLQTALESLLQQAGSKWLAIRIEAILLHISASESLGGALKNAGYNFPDKEAISYLQLLSTLQGFDVAMGKFARHWLQETIEKVHVFSKIFLFASILLMGGMLTAVVLGVSDIQNAIEGSFTN